MKTLDQLFEIMKANKTVRITKDARAEIMNINNNTPIGKRFYVQSVNCDDTVNLCSETHTILENEPISSIL